MESEELDNPLAVDGETANAFWEAVRRTDDDSPEAYLLWDLLVARGWEPPEPSKVHDEDLPNVIGRLVMDLAWVHAYLCFTHHLPDREFYENLYQTVWAYEHWIYPDDPESAVSIGMLDSDDLEDHDLYLRFYAEEDARKSYSKHDPEHEVPPSELPPFPRLWIPKRPLFD